MTFSEDTRILMLDDPFCPHEEVRETLVAHNYRLRWTDSPDEAMLAVREELIDLGLIGLGRDLRRGLTSVQRLRAARPHLGLIVISPRFITELVMKLIELDTYSFLVEPVNILHLEELILGALGLGEKEKGDYCYG